MSLRFTSTGGCSVVGYNGRQLQPTETAEPPSAQGGPLKDQIVDKGLGGPPRISVRWAKRSTMGYRS